MIITTKSINLFKSLSIISDYTFLGNLTLKTVL